MRLTVLRETTGLIAYDGPSLINGRRVVAIITGLTRRTSNAKTGDMLQTWIILPDEHPLEAWKGGRDEAVCGSCVHRTGSCYVALNQGPASVWKSYQKGNYEPLDTRHMRIFRRRLIRVGSYGDPAAAPTAVWKKITARTDGHTGYTHAWRTCDPDLKDLCMASCESLDEVHEARELGWKPFLARPPESPVPKGFFTCPASKEAGHRLTCEQCLACGGGEWDGKKGVPTIEAHGGAVKMSIYRKKTMPEVTTAA